MDNHIDKLTPLALPSEDAVLAKYPPRVLADGARVTRLGPSPTGAMHIGGLYAALISRRLARQSHGVFLLRIEDTDKKREAKGARDQIIAMLDAFDLTPDEGPLAGHGEAGNYGPYTQSERTALYQTFARRLIAADAAYPCFCTADELDAMRKLQNDLKLPPGYYGRWAEWRNRPATDVTAALASGAPFTIRLKAPEKRHAQITLKDGVRGKLTLTTNNNDAVLLKADGTPTYHLAHVVDDHLMGVTDVVRGNEWLASTPLHLQLFDLFGWMAPQYAHIAPIEKLDDASRRKLSKRHDPEAAATFYLNQGYPPESVIEYLTTLSDSGYEDWRKAHPDAPADDLRLDLKRMSPSGALFDLAKLESLSRAAFGRMKADEIYDRTLAWAEIHNHDFADVLRGDPDYVRAILNIERERPQARKDIAKLADVEDSVTYFFDAPFDATYETRKTLLKEFSPAIPATLVETIGRDYNAALKHDAWLDWLRTLIAEYGFAPNAKTLKQNPGRYAGHFGDVAGFLRIALCARKNAPDLHEVMQTMGQARVTARLHQTLTL